MEVDRATRWTIDRDPDMYPSHVMYFDSLAQPHDRQCWWDIKRLALWFFDKGLSGNYKYWLKKTKGMVSGIRDGDGDVFLLKKDTPLHVITDICTTACLLRLIWVWASFTLSRPLTDSCIKIICTCAARVILALPDAMLQIPIEVEGQAINMQVGRHGTITGFQDLLKAHFSRHQWRCALVATWEAMCDITAIDAQCVILSLVVSS